MEQEYETIDLREIFLIVKKNLLVIVAATVVFALVGFLVTTFLITPEYEASATLIVNSREDQQTQSYVTNDQINSAKQLVNTYAVILKSDTVLDKAIEDLGLDETYDELVDKVTIEAVDDTQVMRVAVQDADPQIAQDIVASIVAQAPDIIIRTVKAGSVEVISQPSVLEDPVSPRTMMITAVAGVLGCVLALGVVFLRSMLNNTFMSDEDITKHLEIPVLGVIPKIDLTGTEGVKRGKK